LLKIVKSDGETFTELTLDTLVKNCWFNLINPTMSELEAVAAATNAPMDFLKAALDDEERSRIELEEDHILVIINIPIMLSPTSYDTLPLGIIVCRDYIITVCLENNPIVAEFNRNTCRQFSTAKRTRFLFQFLYKAASYYLKYLRQINRQTDLIELDLRKSMKNKELFQLLELQNALTYFTASLRSNGIVMERLLRMRLNSQSQHLIKMFEEDEDLLEDVIIENNQAIQMVEMYSQILGGMMNAFASIISNNLNMVMKFLTAITIILAIPTMLFSFWGMNVSLPFEHSPMGYVYVLIIAIFIGALSAIALWKKDMF